MYYILAPPTGLHWMHVKQRVNTAYIQYNIHAFNHMTSKANSIALGSHHKSEVKGCQYRGGGGSKVKGKLSLYHAWGCVVSAGQGISIDPRVCVYIFG